jgi:hypothetical protein
MRVPLGWLSEWIDLPGSVEELEERLTMGGLEVEESSARSRSLRSAGGQVITRRDTRMRIGLRGRSRRGEPWRSSAAHPIAAGQKVAVATHGALCPRRAGQRQIRGAPEGICSDREMISDDHDDPS